MSDLTVKQVKQERFCQKYIETGNACEAYRRVVAVMEHLAIGQNAPLLTSGMANHRYSCVRIESPSLAKASRN